MYKLARKIKSSKKHFCSALFSSHTIFRLQKIFDFICTKTEQKKTHLFVIVVEFKHFKYYKFSKRKKKKATSKNLKFHLKCTDCKKN